MTTDQSWSACEAILLEYKNRNLKAGIFPSHNLIIDRLIERRLELLQAFEEVHRKVKGDHQLLNVFFDSLLCIASTWNPEEVAKSRAERNQLKAVNQKIVKAAEELAGLLDERDELNEHSGFNSDTHYHMCRVIEDASIHNGWFNSWVREPFAMLRSRFDMKYWPSMSECIRAIGDDAEYPNIQPSNSTTAAATSSARGGDADFFKAFDCRLKEEGETFYLLHPSRLNLTDAAMAAIASCALERNADDLFDADYVKRWRQRERSVAKTKSKKSIA